MLFQYNFTRQKQNKMKSHIYRIFLSSVTLSVCFMHLQCFASNVKVVKPPSGRAILVADEPISFKCGSVDDQDKLAFKWFKRDLNGTESIISPHDVSFELHNDILKILKPTRKSIGDYICRALNRDTHEPIKDEFDTIMLRMPIFVRDFGVETSHSGRSVSVLRNQSIVLWCNVTEKSMPVNISWYKSITPELGAEKVQLNGTLKSSQEYPLVSDPANSLQDSLQSSIIIDKSIDFTSKLEIRSVGDEHRNYYICVVDNGITEPFNKTIFIRVKDPFGYLWPLIGLIIQVVVLFAIIFICSRNKVQKEAVATTQPISPDSQALLGSTSVGTQINNRKSNKK